MQLRTALRARGLSRHPRPAQPALTARGPNYPAATPRDRSFRVRILQSIHEIDATRWNAVCGRNALSRSHAYLAAVEASGIADCRFFYPIIFDADNTIVAHACVYTITTDFAQLLPRLVHGAVRGVRRRWPRFLSARITECASPLMIGHSISIHPGEDSGRLLHELAATVTGIARAERSAIIVVRDFLTDDRPQFDALIEHGFQCVSNLPLARIAVRWKSYAEYLASMRARYRKDVKRRLKNAAQAGQRVTRLIDFSAEAAQWARQAATVYTSARSFKREALTADYYANIAHFLGDRSLLVAVERNEQKVAHGMVLEDDETTIATYFGRDPGKPGKEWFLLINEVIRIGIERQSRTIQLGLGSYEAKALVGATIEPLFVYCKSTLAPINWLMRLIPNVFAREPRPRRRIFRGA